MTTDAINRIRSRWAKSLPSRAFGVHTHLCEGLADNEAFGGKPVASLVGHRLLDDASLVAHAVHVDDDNERRLLNESGATVAHCPSSNQNNAVGVTPIAALERVALGCDGMHMDMISESQRASLLHKLAHRDPRVATAVDVLAFLQRGAAVASRLFGRRIGTLTPGSAADLVLLDYRAPTPITAQNWAYHLQFGVGAQHVHSTVVAGRVLMHNRAFAAHIDEHTAAQRARKRAEIVWQKINTLNR